jgi:hypothetical protein
MDHSNKSLVVYTRAASTEMKFAKVRQTTSRRRDHFLFRVSPQADYCYPLDDRFHEICSDRETCADGTDGLLADSSFAIGETRDGIMAGWRRAIELAMTDEEMATLVALS